MSQREPNVGTRWPALVFACALPLASGCGDEPRVSLRSSADAAATVTARCNGAQDCDDQDECTADLCVVGNVCDHERISGCVSARRCMRAADCDDGVSCTRDRCLVSGRCDSVADDALCAVGARCDARRGCEGVDAGPPDRVDAGARAEAGVIDDAASAIDATARDVAHADAGAPLDRGVVPDAPHPADVVAAADAGLDPRSGTYTLAPALAYACQDEVFKVPVLSLAVATVTLVARADGATLSWPGGGTELRGPAISGGTLRLSGAVPHPDCSAALTLTASFPDPMRIAGSLALTFSGIGCALTSCEARSLNFQGVRAR